VELESGGCQADERRANIRLSRVLAVALRIGEREINGVAVDLSVSGFQVALACDIAPGCMVAARLHLARHSEVSVKAQVVWVEGLSLNLYRVGFLIEEVDSSEGFERLYRYIEKEKLNVQGLPQDETPALALSTQLSLRTMSDEELERFNALAGISQMLNETSSLETLLSKTLQVSVEATGAERGMMLLDRGGPELEAPLFHTTSGTTNRAFSLSVVERVQSTREPLLSLDAQKDDRLSGSSSLRVMGTRSVLCVPIQARGRDYGTLYLDNSVRAGTLNLYDLKLVTILAAMAASAITRAEDFAQLVQKEKLATIGTLTACFLHELGSPLASILGLSELLQEEVGGETVDLLVEETRHCEQLVADLLRFAKKESVEPTNVDMRSVIESTVSALAPEFKRYGITVEIHLTDAPLVLGNRAQLRQVVTNLLLNAAQATSQGPGGRVELRAKPRKGEFLLVVADNGPGIEPENLSRIFDPFFTTKKEDEGTGLGLSIIARIVHEHRGTIRVENQSEGGALFQLTLPLIVA